MPDADEDVRADEARAEEDADFASGFKDEPSSKATVKPEPEAKPEPKAEVKKEEPPADPPKPEYVQLTKEQYDRLESAANRTASLEQQMSKAFGSIGHVQGVINKLQAETPRGIKVDIPKDAFDEMVNNGFPELAQYTRAALEKTLRGITGTGPANAEIDSDELRRLVGEHAAKHREETEKAQLEREFDELKEEHPDWEKIIGRVDTAKQDPDPNNAFRKWLGTKGEAYQKKVHTTWSGAVISSAIERFQRETRPAPKQTQQSLQQQLRASRIADAVTPRGDGGQAPPGRSEDDEFEAGYASR